MATILVVDDSLTDRKLAGGLLEKNAGWQVLYASDGKAALAELERHLPDLVLTDLQMPEMDGLELVAEVKRAYPLIPVVLMTAKGSEEIAVQALNAGAASYVAKRALAPDLVETVEQILAVSREERGHARLMHRLDHSEHHFVLENDLSLILSAVTFLKRGITDLRLGGESDRLRVGVALEEALVNAFYHGNLEVGSELREVDYKAYYELARQRCGEMPYKDRLVHVSARFNHQEAAYTVRDEGPGFDPSQLPDPTDPVNLDRPSGRGLLLMRTFMDDVRYNAAGNEVTLVKRKRTDSARASGHPNGEMS